MLYLTGIEGGHIDQARSSVTQKLSDGSALEKLRQNIELQGGDAKVCDNPEILLDTNIIKSEIVAADDGYVSGIDASSIGEAIGLIGGGRIKAEDRVDAAVGYVCETRIGDKINVGETLGVLYSRDEAQAHQISEKLRSAYKIGDEKPPQSKLIKEIIR
jgi:pyrimidine-nucleoside phosphorylase